MRLLDLRKLKTDIAEGILVFAAESDARVCVKKRSPKLERKLSYP